MDNSISLRPPKYNFKKRKVSNKKDNSLLKKTIKFKICQCDSLEEEYKTLLLQTLESITNKNTIIDIKREIDDNCDYNNLLNYIFNKFKYSLNIKTKKDIEKYNTEVVEEKKESYEEEFDNFNYNLNKINNNIDISLLGNFKDLNLNDEYKQENEEIIFSDEN